MCSSTGILIFKSRNRERIMYLNRKNIKLNVCNYTYIFFYLYVTSDENFEI